MDKMKFTSLYLTIFIIIPCISQLVQRWTNCQNKQKNCITIFNSGKISISWYDALKHCKRVNSVLSFPATMKDIKIEQMKKIGIKWFLNAHLQLYNEKGAAFADHSLISLTNFSWEIQEEFEPCIVFNIENLYTHSVKCFEPLNNISFACNNEEKSNLQCINKGKEISIDSSIDSQKFKCPPNWIEIPGQSENPSCVEIISLVKELSWNDAFRICRGLKSELYFPETAQEIDWFLNITFEKLVPFSKYVDSNIFINLHKFMYCQDQNTSWCWPNGIRYENQSQILNKISNLTENFDSENEEEGECLLLDIQQENIYGKFRSERIRCHEKTFLSFIPCKSSKFCDSNRYYPENVVLTNNSCKISEGKSNDSKFGLFLMFLFGVICGILLLFTGIFLKRRLFKEMPNSYSLMSDPANTGEISSAGSEDINTFANFSIDENDTEDAKYELKM